MTTSQDLLDAAIAALKGPDGGPAPTDAGQRVYSPGDWPVWGREYPVVLARVLSEDKTSIGRATIEFTVVTALLLSLRVSALADADDGGANAAEIALWALARQAEIAVINSYPLTSLLQQFPYVRSELKFSAEGEKHLAEVQMTIGLEFYQGPEDFAPIASRPLTSVGASPIGLPIQDESGDPITDELGDVLSDNPNFDRFGLEITLPQ